MEAEKLRKSRHFLFKIYLQMKKLSIKKLEVNKMSDQELSSVAGGASFTYGLSTGSTCRKSRSMGSGYEVTCKSYC